MIGPPCFREFAFDGGFEDGGTVALQVRLCPIQGRNPGVQVGEQFLGLEDDPLLFLQRWDGKLNLANRPAPRWAMLTVQRAIFWNRWLWR